MTVDYIYGLRCPILNEIRYIGKSIHPKERLQNHMNDKSKCHRSHWLQKLKASNLKPTIEILEVVGDGFTWQERERYWIAKGRDLGWPLTNNTSGGDGVCDLHPDSLMRIRTAWIGRKHKPETLKLIGASSRLRKHSDERKQHMSNIMTNREITWGDKIAVAIRKFTEDDCALITERLSNGEKVKDIADEYGVHRTTVSKIKMGNYFVK